MSGFHIPINYPRMLKIKRVHIESAEVKSFIFEDAQCAKAKPGQFVMVWIPGVDEIPMSLSFIGPKNLAGITVLKLGKATAALHKKKRGDIIGIRGPYGNPFTLITGRAMMLGGGTGVAPLVPLAERLVEQKTKITFILGVKTVARLLFMGRIEAILSKNRSKLIVTTDDGSYGIKGLASDPVKGLLKADNYDMLYACGREKLLFAVFKQAERAGVPVQASLERYMKCGIGICGQCVLDPLGLMVCKDGPVFKSEVLRKITDFGAYTRDASGKKIPI